MRGSARRRYVTPEEDARVWCSGRWGQRRVRVTECWAFLTAEDVYTQLIRRDPEGAWRGSRGSYGCTLTKRSSGQTRSVQVEWEVQPNAAWRFGRGFLICAKCGRLATRLYLPTCDTPAWCRRCWGLTYESRKANYRTRRFWGPILGSWAEAETILARERRRLASAARYAQRREILDSK